MNDIEAIKARHAVRNYKPDRIEPNKVALINEKIDELNKAGNLHLQFMEEAGNTFNRLLNKAMGLGSAPSVIACVGNDDDSVEFINKGGPYAKVDLGIVKYHFEVGRAQ